MQLSIIAQPGQTWEVSDADLWKGGEWGLKASGVPRRMGFLKWADLESE